MAEGVDIDLYDNLEEDFNQDADYNHDSDLYDDVITAPASQDDMDLYSHGVDPESSQDTRDHDRASSVYFARNRHGEMRHDTKSGSSAPIMPANYTGKRVSLYVGNLTWWTTDQDLTDIIASIGVPDLLEIKFYENRANGQSKGFAVVAVGSEASSRIIFDKLPKKKIHSQTPIVTHCNRTSLNQFEAQARKGEPPPPTAKEPNSKPAERGPSGSSSGNRREPSRYVSRNSRTSQSSPQQGPPGPPGPPPSGPPPPPYNAFKHLKRAYTTFRLSPPRPGGPPPPVPPPPGVPLVGPPPRQPGGPPPPGMPPRPVPPPQRGPPPPDPRLAPPRPDWDRPAADHRPHHSWNPMVPFPGSASSSTLGQPHPPGTSFNGSQHWKGGPPLHQPPPVSAPPPGHPPTPAPHVNPAFFPPQHGQPPPTGPMIPVGQFETLPFLDPDVKFHANHPPHSQPGDMYVRPPPPAAYPNDPYGRPPERHESASPAISEQEFEEIFQRNKTVSSSAISRAVQDASAGDFASAIETLVTAISLIKQSKIAGDDRCKILISSLQDTLHGIEEKSYGSKKLIQKKTKKQNVKISLLPCTYLPTYNYYYYYYYYYYSWLL
ncbi:cleavage and polyadenylation specificity factor subunit 6-like isoform X2 [Octopus vulgaris]|uniref:Cleavage and polyadenylation specificity factor subunit 6 n=1 Tax=Octopus vulgaris TaxID=6645 RepID=A0AA36C0F0_OCTVU|nr:cleavage and polyadenylation specificity factor subunit 6-like isoform X2 [Octopus vulgaris]